MNELIIGFLTTFGAGVIFLCLCPFILSARISREEENRQYGAEEGADLTRIFPAE